MNEYTRETCSTCAFFRSGGKVMSECRRFPTVVMKSPNDWCYEYYGIEQYKIKIARFKNQKSDGD